MMNKNRRGFGWLQIVIVLAILVIVAYAIFNVFLPQITTAAQALGVGKSEDRLVAGFTPATFQTHKGLVEGFLNRVKEDIEIRVTITGEIHRTGFIGEECFICVDYRFEARQRIPFHEFRRGLKTYRVQATDISGGADEGNIANIDGATVKVRVDVIPKNNVRGSGRGVGETWGVWLHMVDENGQPMIDAETRKPLMLMLGTISNIQTHGREISYQVSPAYEYENTDDQANDQEVTI